MCSTSITAATSPATTSTRWRRACVFVSSTPPSGDHRAEARSSACSAPSTPSCCPSCRDTLLAAGRRPRRACHWRSWIGPSAPSSPTPITPDLTARPARGHLTPGEAAASCRAAPIACRTSICCSSCSPSRAACGETAFTSKDCATSTQSWPPMSARPSPSATIRVTSPNYEFSTATSSCAGR